MLVRPVGKIKIFLLIGGVILASGLFAVYFIFRPPKPVPLPNPNGYDDFVAAGEMVQGKVPDWKTGSVEELREFVSANRAALDRGRLGLTKQCRVPVEYSTTWLAGHTKQIMATRQLVHALCAEGKLAGLEKGPGSAAASYLMAINIGAKLARGGVMIDGLIATACEGEGEMRLESELETLDIEQSRKLIAELEEVQAEQATSAQIIKQEKMWTSGALRSIKGFKMYVGEVVETHSLNTTENEQKRFVAEYDARLKWAGQWQAKLAAHAYSLEKGHVPASWSDLVPAYLESVPNVPFGPGDTNRLSFSSYFTPGFF